MSYLHLYDYSHIDLHELELKYLLFKHCEFLAHSATSDLTDGVYGAFKTQSDDVIIKALYVYNRYLNLCVMHDYVAVKFEYAYMHILSAANYKYDQILSVDDNDAINNYLILGTPKHDMITVDGFKCEIFDKSDIYYIDPTRLTLISSDKYSFFDMDDIIIKRQVFASIPRQRSSLLRVSPYLCSKYIERDPALKNKFDH